MLLAGRTGADRRRRREIMTKIEEKIQWYERKFRNCETMTDLVIAMSSWQNFARSNGLSEDQRRPVDQVYLEMESKLITGLSQSLW